MEASNLPYQDRSSGDLIIRTVDNVDFHFFRERLANIPSIDLPPSTDSKDEKPSIIVE